LPSRWRWARLRVSRGIAGTFAGTTLFNRRRTEHDEHDGRAVRKEDWPAYAEAVRFLEVRYRRPGIQGGDPLPEVQFSCPFTGERLRRYGVPTWLGVSQVRQDPGAFTAYVRAKEAAGEWTDSADTVTGDQLREALSEMPAGDDGRAWLESALSRRGDA
jgi:hypothetical protein